MIQVPFLSQASLTLRHVTGDAVLAESAHRERPSPNPPWGTEQGLATVHHILPSRSISCLGSWPVCVWTGLRVCSLCALSSMQTARARHSRARCPTRFLANYAVHNDPTPSLTHGLWCAEYHHRITSGTVWSDADKASCLTD